MDSEETPQNPGLIFCHSLATRQQDDAQIHQAWQMPLKWTLTLPASLSFHLYSIPYMNILLFLTAHILDVLVRRIRQGKEIKAIHIGKKEVKLSVLNNRGKNRKKKERSSRTCRIITKKKKKSKFMSLESLAGEENCQHRTWPPVKCPSGNMMKLTQSTHPSNSRTHHSNTHIQHTQNRSINLKIFKILEITQKVCSYHDGIRVEINNRREKLSKHLGTNNTFLHNPWAKNILKGNFKKYIGLNVNKMQHIKVCGTQPK